MALTRFNTLTSVKWPHSVVVSDEYLCVCKKNKKKLKKYLFFRK